MIERIKSLMDSIKRIAAALVGAVLVALLTVQLLAPQSMADFVSGWALALRLLVVILIYAAAAYLIYRQYQYPPVKGLVVRSTGTLATLNTESARDAIVKAVREIDGVRAVRAEVKPARRGWAQIELRVAVQGDHINLPDKEQEINRALIQVAEKRLGLSLAKRPLVLITLGDSEAALDAIKTPDQADVAEPRTEVVPPSASADEPQEKAEPASGLMGRLFTKSDKQAEESEPEPEAEPAPIARPSTKAEEEDPLATDEFYNFLKSTVPANSADTDTSEAEAAATDDSVMEAPVNDEPLPPTVEPDAVEAQPLPGADDEDREDAGEFIVDEQPAWSETDESDDDDDETDPSHKGDEQRREG